MERLLVFILKLFSLLVLSVQMQNSNQSFEFIITNEKNATGHWNVHFSLGRNQITPPNWKVNLSYNTNSFNGGQKFLLEGHFTAPPAIPDDYELFPGIGYYKFNPEKNATFDEAQAICAYGGGHLAIINSEEEANVIKTIYARHPNSHDWAIVGFHDRKKQGEFVTIFGEPLSSTGYNKWHPDEPDYSGGIVNCGCIDRGGLFGAVTCFGKRPFFCEYELSWSNN